MAAFTQKKPLVYRLEEIPTVTSKNDLLLLFPPKTRDRMTVTSLSPSINLDRRTLTATISFLAESQEPFPMPSDPDICVDKDFYGFTPLYTPDSHIDVDIIAITGLAGHAFGSWSTATQRMWLRDFLPRDLPQARVLLYGYDSHIVNSQSRSILADFSSNFIAKFNAMRSRSHCEDRPVIFIGHSLGCLMIKEVLIDLGSYLDHRNASTRPMVKSIIFFGAPHRGLEVTAMQSMVHGMPSEDLIRELNMHSPTLERLNDGFRRVYEGVNILTIYELEPTASLQRDEFDSWKRTGPPVIMVDKASAILYWPMESRIGLNQDHSRIAKVNRGQNGCYDDICHFLQQSLGSTHKVNVKPKVNAPTHPSALTSSSNDILVKGRQLCEALKEGDCETARDLVHSVEMGWLAKLGGDPLCLAVEHCPETVSTLLDAGADLSATCDDRGTEAIHFAGKYAKNPETVQLLLDAGADVNARQGDRWMPLHFAACYNNNPKFIQALIDAGATVNAPNNRGNTPLHLAAQENNNPDILQVLIDAGANVNDRDPRGYTPLHCAAIFEIVQILADAGADVNARDKHENTPLHHAAEYKNSVDVLRALIKANADVNATGDEERSPLMLSVRNEDPEICRELLAAGAHPNHGNSKGYTALHRAVKYGNKAVVSHLLAFGADPKAMSKDGTTPENQKFIKSVPSVTKTEIRELISKAIKPSEMSQK